LPDDDLWLWANAEFKYDMPPGVGIYEDEMGVKLAMSQQQFQQTQQHQLQHQQQQQQPQQQQPQPQSHVAAATSQAPSHSLQYQLQFDLHRYLDANSEGETFISTCFTPSGCCCYQAFCFLRRVESEC
jgi:hypothetical protein